VATEQYNDHLSILYWKLKMLSVFNFYRNHFPLTSSLELLAPSEN